MQFQLTQILQPTCVELYRTSQGQHKKLLFSRESAKIDPLSLKLDFKDVELILYLRSKTALDLKKAFPPTTPAAGAKTASTEKPDRQATHAERQKLHKRMGTAERIRTAQLGGGRAKRLAGKPGY